MAQEHSLTARPIRLPNFLRERGWGASRGTGGSRTIAAGLPSAGIGNRPPPSGGHFLSAPEATVSANREAQCGKDLMCPDLLSEIVLVGLILVTRLLLLVAAFVRN